MQAHPTKYQGFCAGDEWATNTDEDLLGGQLNMKQINKLNSILSAVVLMAASTSTVLAELPDPNGKSADMSKPVKVFNIMGQSNTLEMGRVKGDKDGTLEHAVKKEKLYPFMVDDAGDWTKRMDVRNVHTQGSGGPNGRGGVRRNDWLTVSGGKVGIEIGIGHHLGNALDEPVLILKSSIGNRSLGWDLLPPGSPRHEVETTDRAGNKVTLVTPAFKDEVRHPSWTKGAVPEPPKHNWHAARSSMRRRPRWW